MMSITMKTDPIVPTLRVYDQHRKVQILGEMWKATRKSHTLRVQLRTHPEGWEVRAFVGLEIHRSIVAKTETDVFTISNQWRAEALARGWTVDPSADSLGSPA